jgi:hypothetical protein
MLEVFSFNIILRKYFWQTIGIFRELANLTSVDARNYT